MREILNLLNPLKEKDFSTRYPQYNLADGKVHVLYLECHANGTGLYRFMLPVIEINKTETHSAILGSVLDWDHSNQVERYFNLDNNSPLRKLVEWADYIILPTYMSPIYELLNFFKTINGEKKYMVGMDVDDNYHKLPSSHHLYGNATGKVNKHLQAQLVHNLAAIDFIVSPNDKLMDFYRDQVKLISKKKMPEKVLLCNLLHTDFFSDVDMNTPRPKFEKYRIGLVVNQSHYLDVNHFRKVIAEVQKKHQDIEFIVFGWDGENHGYPNALRGCKVTVVKEVPVKDYFKTLNSLCLDAAIIPLNPDIEFNKYKAFQRFLEFASCKIPVIVTELDVYTDLIKLSDKPIAWTVNGTMKQWVDTIEAMHITAEVPKKMSEDAWLFIWQHCSYNDQRRKELTDIFKQLN